MKMKTKTKSKKSKKPSLKIKDLRTARDPRAGYPIKIDVPPRKW